MKMKPFATYAEKRKAICRWVAPIGYSRWTSEMHAVNEQCDTLRFAVCGKKHYSSLPPEDKAFRLRWRLKTIASISALWLLTACGESPPPSYTFAYVKQNISGKAVFKGLNGGISR